MDPKATEPIPGIQIQPPQPPQEPPVPVPLVPKPPRNDAPTEAPPRYSFDEKPKFRIMSKILITLIILVSIVVVATGAGAFYLYQVSPAQTVSSAIDRLSTEKKVHVGFKLALDSEEATLVGSQVEVTNKIDRSVTGSPSVQSIIDLRSPMFSGSVEIRYINSVLYGHLITLPEKYKAQMGAASTLWYSVSLDTILKLQKEKGFDVASTTSKWGSLSNVYTKLLERGILEEPVFSGIKSTEDGWVREYTIGISKDALVEAIVVTSRAAATDPTYVEAMRTQIKASLDMISFAPIVVRTSLGGSLQDLKGGIDFLQAIPMVGRVDGITYTITSDEALADSAIQAPEGAFPVDEYILEEMLTSEAKKKVASIKTQISEAQNLAAVYYTKGKVYTGLCTKEIGIKQLFTELRSAGSVTSCKSTAKSYLMTASLPKIGKATTTSIYCVDSTGLRATLAKVPAGYVCK